MDGSSPGSSRFVARLRALRADRVGERDAADAADQESGGRERGGRDASLDGAPPPALVALNDEIADGRDVSWIWDVDFEPLLAGSSSVIVSGSRAAELALRFAYGGLRARHGSRSIAELERALDRGLELTPAGGELVVLPTYTAMLALRAVAARAADSSRVLEAASVRIRVGHLYPE